MADKAEAGHVGFEGRGGRRARVLAYSGRSRKVLAQDERYLYWSDDEDGTITRLPKDGGVPLILVTGQPCPRGIAIADGWIYWANDRTEGSVLRTPLEGGDVEVIADGEDSPHAIAVHGDTVVWTTWGDSLDTGTLRSAPVNGGTAVTLASGLMQPDSLAIDARCVYWSNHGTKHPWYFENGSVMWAPRDGRKGGVVAEKHRQASSLVADGEAIYWMTVRSYDEPAAPGALWRRRKDGGEPIQLASWRWNEGGALAVDASFVYVLRVVHPALLRVPKGGGVVEEIAGSEDGLTFFPRSMVVDERCVYWTATDAQAAGGAVFKMAK